MGTKGPGISCRCGSGVEDETGFKLVKSEGELHFLEGSSLNRLRQQQLYRRKFNCQYEPDISRTLKCAKIP